MPTSSPLFAWKRFTLEEREHTFPNGLVTSHITLTHPGAVLILPVANDGKLVMIHQYRPSIDRWIYEFPAGTMELNESPDVCAKRELAEEVQLAASEWHKIGESLPAPGFCDETQYLYVAKQVSDCEGELDDDEVLEVVHFPVDEVARMIANNDIQDSKTIVAFCRAQLLGLIR
ncbi:ADP-ribose pyrophosphatase [Enterovibrio norvegicus FF-454]|uniref:GDP-mannose pyrophosphatase n=1 Tax=Enterovibrio norvegicus FF-454 TaxID=1185651 RepID=A0A1E5CEZ8_9GAMM|nr:NUDIX hydrolase [Enterovibrio norvegicus]OEE64104.1 ADP-ribose pyrophosphatase [Enterovibrio norvegicus FF-454]